MNPIITGILRIAARFSQIWRDLARSIQDPVRSRRIRRDFYQIVMRNHWFGQIRCLLCQKSTDLSEKVAGIWKEWPDFNGGQRRDPRPTAGAVGSSDSGSGPGGWAVDLDSSSLRFAIGWLFVCFGRSVFDCLIGHLLSLASLSLTHGEEERAKTKG